MKLDCGRRELDLSQPRIMGVLNVTPDSFSDGGQWLNPDAAFRHAIAMTAAGADIIDIGGESTRPGATVVSVQQELDRVLPLVERLHAESGVFLSVDTSTPEVMRAAASAGADLINDVRALTRDGALAAATAAGLGVCLMHMQGTPATMQLAPHYDDVVAEVRDWLRERAAACVTAGIERTRLLLDPGIGFGKDDRHNLALLRELPELAKVGYPLLVGVSRKSMIGRLLGRDMAERLPASLALALFAVQRGVAIVRVHDVAATSDVLRLWQLLKGDA